MVVDELGGGSVLSDVNVNGVESPLRTSAVLRWTT